MDGKEIERLMYRARNISDLDNYSIEKNIFQSLLTGMKAKVLKSKSTEAERQLSILNRMDNFLERLTYRNVIFHFQAQTITAQDRQIMILEEEKMSLIEENNNLKSRIQ